MPDMNAELILLKAALAMTSIEPLAAVAGGFAAALLVALAIECGTEEAAGQILLVLAGIMIVAGPIVWLIFNLFFAARLSLNTLPIWHLGTFVIGAVAGFWFGVYLTRRFTPKVERLKKRLTVRTRLERNRRTDVRDIEAFVPKLQPEYDARKYFKAGEYFLGLGEDGSPVYWTGRLPHVQIVGTTGAGKGVALGMMGAQALLNGAGVLFIDPKDDEYGPSVLFDAARRAGVCYRYIDLRPTATAQLNLFAGATAAEIEELFLAGFGLSDKGEAADFYRVADRKAAALVSRVAADGDHTPASLYGAVRASIDEDAPLFSGLLAEMAELPAVNGRGGYDLAELLEKGGAVYVVGSMRNAKVLRLQRMLLIRLIQLAERRDRTAKEKPRAVVAILDELKTQISRPAMEALQAARDKGVSVLMAHQAVADLRDCPADMDAESVVGAVMENCALKLCYRVRDPDTAEWLSRKSGVIQVDDEVRAVKKGLALAERVEGERSIRQAERFFIDENMMQNLPNRVGVVYGLGLAKFVQTAPLKVEKTAEALKVVAAPQRDATDAAVAPTRSGGSRKRRAKANPEPGGALDDGLEASL